MILLLAAPVSGGVVQLEKRLPIGPSHDLVEAGGYLYAAQGGEVKVYDISSPDRIASLSWESALSRCYDGDLIRSLRVDGGYLYIADQSRFAIADIADPANPTILSSMPIASGTLRDVAVKGEYAYLSVSGQGIVVVGIADRRSPAVVKTLKLPTSNKPWRSAIQDDYLYVAVESINRLDVFSIANPANPVRVANYSAKVGSNSFSSVAVRDSTACVVEYQKGLRIVNVSDPLHPVELANLAGLKASDVAILDTAAYVSVQNKGLAVVDIADPANPVLIAEASTADLAGPNEGIAAIPGFVFQAGEVRGFGAYDTAMPASPRLISRVPTIAAVQSLAAKDSYLYIGTQDDGVWVVDVNDVDAPREVAYVETRGRSVDLAIQGTYLYVAGTAARLSVIDIANPAAPVLAVRNYTPAGVSSSITAVLADGDRLYTNIGIVDISDPRSPSYLVRSNVLSGGRFAKYDSDHLVVARTSGTKGIGIVNVSNPKKPVLVSTFGAGTAYNDVTVSGTVAAGLTASGIAVVDLATPAAPRLLSNLSYTGSWTASRVESEAATVYAAGSKTDLYKVFDISDPSSIRLADAYALPNTGTYSALAVDGQHVYTGNKFHVYILNRQPSDPLPGPTPVPTETTPVPAGTTAIPADTPAPDPSVTPPEPTDSPTPELTTPAPTDSPTPEPMASPTPGPAAGPVANFTANATAGHAPLAVAFHDLSEGAIASRTWSFGDGTVSGEADPVHVYASAGNWTVILTVESASGNDTLVRAGYIETRDPAPAPTITVVYAAQYDDPGTSSGGTVAAQASPAAADGDEDDETPAPTPAATEPPAIPATPLVVIPAGTEAAAPTLTAAAIIEPLAEKAAEDVPLSSERARDGYAAHLTLTSFGTASGTALVRRYGSAHDFDSMLSWLVRATGGFALVIGCWLASAILL